MKTMIPFKELEEEMCRTYRFANEKMNLGDTQLYMILYKFYGLPKKFMSAALYFRGKKNYELLKNICQTKFGKPIGRGFYEFHWEGQIALISLIYDFVDDFGVLNLGSTRIFAEYTKNKKRRQAQEAEKDW